MKSQEIKCMEDTMIKYIDAEKIIAEIDYRLHCNGAFDEVGDYQWHYDQGMVDAYKYIREVVTSLQQEQPEVDLEKEIDACWQNWISPSNQSSVEGVLPKSEFSMYARHFYELGLNARKEESK